MDWTEVLAVDDENLRARLAAEILGSGSYRSTGEMVRAFVQQPSRFRAGADPERWSASATALQVGWSSHTAYLAASLGRRRRWTQRPRHPGHRGRLNNFSICSFLCRQYKERPKGFTPKVDRNPNNVILRKKRRKAHG
jgi:hypothetical protein